MDDIKDWDLNKRTENYQFIAGRLNKLFLTKTSKEWEKLLVGINVPASTVNTIEEVIQNAQFQYRDVWSQYAGFQFAGMPALINNKNIKISGNAPSLGEHTNQIVKELNYTKEQIGKLNSEKTTPIPLE